MEAYIFLGVMVVTSPCLPRQKFFLRAFHILINAKSLLYLSLILVLFLGST